MDHIAIMKKAWGLTPKILSGQKKIESRWYKTKHSPWGQIRVGETVYFKDSGEPVTLKATVAKVLQFENLTPSKVRALLDQYGQDDGLGISDLEKFWEILKDKKYCLLIYLTNPQPVEPFEIDKRGFGNMAAWITTSDIHLLQRTVLLKNCSFINFSSAYRPVWQDVTFTVGKNSPNYVKLPSCAKLRPPLV